MGSFFCFSQLDIWGTSIWGIGSAQAFCLRVEGVSTVTLVGLEKNQDVLSSVRTHLAFGNVT